VKNLFEFLFVLYFCILFLVKVFTEIVLMFDDH
jgi:hypothetical protein